LTAPCFYAIIKCSDSGTSHNLEAGIEAQEAADRKRKHADHARADPGHADPQDPRRGHQRHRKGRQSPVPRPLGSQGCVSDQRRVHPPS